MTVLLIARNLISILKEVHKKGILYRDLKPGNICYDSFHDNVKKLLSTINIIDFGLANKFSYENLRKNNSKNYQYFVGTSMFENSVALSGIAHHPKDEFVVIFYILIYLKNGQLPWVKNQNNDKNIYLNEILMMHKNTPLNILFDGFCEDFPFLFITIKNLSVYDKPDYDMYIQIIEIAILTNKKNTNKKDFKYDWEIKLNNEYTKLKNNSISNKELQRISFLKKGYDFSLEE